MERSSVSFQTRWFNQTLDHFRFGSNAPTWRQRYLYNDDNWGKPSKGSSGSKANPPQLPVGCKGPILFYSGNEGPIDAFWGVNGFMIEELAPKWGALLVFGEERYYGASLPFGNASLEPDNAVYLSTEQVLADYATLLTWLKTTTPGMASCPVITFGGSYGGTLSTYFRLKYPQVVVGALAASAPIGYYANGGWEKHGVNQYTWIDIVNRDYEEAHPLCMTQLTKAVALIHSLAGSSQGRQQLQKTFHTCQPVGDPQLLSDWLTDVLETLPQEDYPYAIGTLPAWPVNATCALVTAARDDAALLAAAASVADWYYARPQGGCVSGQGQGGIPGGGPGPGSSSTPGYQGSWGYQSCTETLHAFSGRGFRQWNFSLADSAAQCDDWYGVRPNPFWSELHWGGYAIAEGRTGISNVIWSNGLRDPWHGGGFLSSKVASCPVLLMPLGAHHLDLRGPHPQDPPQVTATRVKEESIMMGWLNDYAAQQRQQDN